MTAFIGWTLEKECWVVTAGMGWMVPPVRIPGQPSIVSSIKQLLSGGVQQVPSQAMTPAGQNGTPKETVQRIRTSMLGTFITSEKTISWLKPMTKQKVPGFRLLRRIVPL
ncbi:MAG: hypothetical protein ACETWG_00095 [Candidatus Neomarinimicrobiota bacterium]